MSQGLVPKWDEYALVGALQGHMAFKWASRQASLGVDPELAAHRAYIVTANTLSFFLWVAFPFTVWFTLGLMFTMPPLLNLWWMGMFGWFAWLSVRMGKYYSRLATLTPVYRAPTNIIFVSGALWTYGLPLVAFWVEVFTNSL